MKIFLLFFTILFSFNSISFGEQAAPLNGYSLLRKETLAQDVNISFAGFWRIGFASSELFALKNPLIAPFVPIDVNIGDKNLNQLYFESDVNYIKKQFEINFGNDSRGRAIAAGYPGRFTGYFCCNR